MNTPPVDDVLRACGFATLGTDPPADSLESVLRKLADRVNGADPVRRESLREGALKLLKGAGVKAPGRMVDAALTPTAPEAEAELQGRGLALVDPEPWPDPVDGAALLVELARSFPKYLALPPGAATAVALWVLHAHAHDAAEVSPLLVLSSPVKRCGKTTALTLVGAVVPRPLPASNITGPALFRAVERWRPTLLVDEADSFMGDREDLRGILNSGHNRAGAFVVRTVGDEHEARIFSTWAPKAIALIGKLADTLTDRSVEVSMRRRGPGETVERLRLDRLADLEPLRRKCWTWAQAHLEELKAADPEIPDGLHDRAQDNWRPMLAIADLAGGPWPDRARKAAQLLSGMTEDDEVGTYLLEDLKTLFKGRDRIPSAELVEALVKMEHRPWPEWRRGQPLTTRALAKLLKPYGIRPKAMDWSGTHPKGTRGYDSGDFPEVWERYLPAESTPPQPQPLQPSYCHNGFPDSHKCNRNAGVADTEKGETPTATTKVAEVAIAEGVPRGPVPPAELPDLWSGGEGVEP